MSFTSVEPWKLLAIWLLEAYRAQPCLSPSSWVYQGTALPLSVILGLPGNSPASLRHPGFTREQPCLSPSSWVYQGTALPLSVILGLPGTALPLSVILGLPGHSPASLRHPGFTGHSPASLRHPGFTRAQPCLSPSSWVYRAHPCLSPSSWVYQGTALPLSVILGLPGNSSTSLLHPELTGVHSCLPSCPPPPPAPLPPASFLPLLLLFMLLSLPPSSLPNGSNNYCTLFPSLPSDLLIDPTYTERGCGYIVPHRLCQINVIT